MQNDRILLFIPAYNCEKQITRVLEQLGPAEMAFISKVIVVNNQSTDGTEEAVLNFMHAHASLPITLLRNRENYGLGGSHKVAFMSWYFTETIREVFPILSPFSERDITGSMTAFSERDL